jgi:hypothetical protein
MKPKQKHKRGLQRYSLDIYTSLTRDECQARLKAARKDFPKYGGPYISFKGNKFVIKLYPARFYGWFEPYITGTHVYGNVLNNSDKSLFPLMIVFFAAPILLIQLFIAIIKGTPIYEVGLLALFVLFIGFLICLFLTLLPWSNKSRGEHLLHWIDEQLNVEATHETKTKA